jgi:hypothetical protein
VRTARLICAAVVLGAAVSAAMWLANYQVLMLIPDRRRTPDWPYPIHFFEIQAPAWWGAYGAVALLIVAVVLAARLVPERAHLLERSRELLLNPLRQGIRPGVLLRRGSRVVLRGVDWFVAEPVRLLVKR